MTQLEEKRIFFLWDKNEGIDNKGPANGFLRMDYLLMYGTLFKDYDVITPHHSEESKCIVVLEKMIKGTASGEHKFDAFITCAPADFETKAEENQDEEVYFRRKYKRTLDSYKMLKREFPKCPVIIYTSSTDFKSKLAKEIFYEIGIEYIINKSGSWKADLKIIKENLAYLLKSKK